VHGSGAFISHKHSVGALRYWVCMHICKPIIIGGGGYPAGAFHDIVVARRDVVPLMQGNERGIADHGYHDDRYHDAVEDKSLARKRLDPTLVAAYEQAMKFVSGRHEHVNAELKEFAVLRERFRHDPVLHPVCFRAVAMLTQLRFELNPSIIPAPQFAPVFVEDDGHLHILKFYGDGRRRRGHTSINEEFVYRASKVCSGHRDGGPRSINFDQQMQQAANMTPSKRFRCSRARSTRFNGVDALTSLINAPNKGVFGQSTAIWRR
jgi:hypothetical protein